MTTYTAYNRTSPYTAQIVGRAPSLEALQQQLQATSAKWTDIYSNCATVHVVSPRGQAQIRLFIRERERGKNQANKMVAGNAVSSAPATNNRPDRSTTTVEAAN